MRSLSVSSTLAVATTLGLTLTACGQEPSVPPTQAPVSLDGCSPKQSKPAMRDARAVDAAVDLDHDGVGDALKVTRDESQCPGRMFAKVKGRLVSVRLPDATVDLTSAQRVVLPGRVGDLLAVRSGHPRGGFQVRLFGYDGELDEVTARSRPLVPFVATDTRGGYVSARCKGDTIVVREAVAHEPPGIVFAWDIKETPYTVKGNVATKGATTETADNVLDDRLGTMFPDVKKRQMFTKGCSAG